VTCLERLCDGPDQKDWIAAAPGLASDTGVLRIEAEFAGHGYDLHRHDTYSLGYTLKGVQSFEYRGWRRESVPGQSIVLHPDEVHDGQAGDKTGFHYRMLYLEPRLVQRALRKRASALPFVKDAVSSSPQLMNSIMSSLDDLSRPLEPLEIDQLVLDLSEALLSQDPSNKENGNDKDSTVSECALKRARELIDAEAVRGVNSTELESCTGLQRYEICRQFKRYFGTSPHRYQTFRRLTLAREGIELGSEIRNVALDCGFSDQSHLTRTFKKAFGLTPGRYQQIVSLDGGYRSLQT